MEEEESKSESVSCSTSKEVIEATAKPLKMEENQSKSESASRSSLKEVVEAEAVEAAAKPLKMEEEESKGESASRSASTEVVEATTTETSAKLVKMEEEESKGESARCSTSKGAVEAAATGARAKTVKMKKKEPTEKLQKKNENSNSNWRDRSKQGQSMDTKHDWTWKKSSNFNVSYNSKHEWQNKKSSNSNVNTNFSSSEDHYNFSSKKNQGNKRFKHRQDTSRFDEKCLMNLCSMSSEEAMTQVAKNEKEFENFISEEMKPDILVLMIKVLKNICQANFTVTISKILNQACSDNFLRNLENYLTKLPFEGKIDKLHNQVYHECIESFWENLVQFAQKVIELMPRTACDKLTSVLKRVKMIIPSIESTQNYKIADKIKDDVLAMITDLEKEIENIERKSTANIVNAEQGPEPLQSFREMSVIPTLEDLNNKDPFLRPAKIKDAYDSVEQYLDVQFRLLREDFVRPLRNGIDEFLGNQKNRNNDLRVYRNAKLVNFEVTERNAGIRLYFGQLNYVNWKRSKRLMYGGLLLLSKNNFKTIIFATVANRDEKDLLQGFIMIEPCKGTIITPDMFNCPIVLLESKIYFEPYHAILTAMKNIYYTNFPMEPYFIQNATSSKLPRYLENQLVLKFKNYLLPIRDNGEWPKPIQLRLDESQFEAFKSALTQEVAIIQGPPGTGKTFLALQIVRALLENKSRWEQYGPIVVVCLTNHALDQFLEGILRHTKSILRVGSRLKSDTLKQYSLKEKRRSFHNDAIFLMYDLQRKTNDILKQINQLNLFIKYLTAPNSVVPLEALQNCRDDVVLKSFKKTEDFICWLLGMQLTFSIETSNEEEALVKEVFKESTRLFDDDENYGTDADLVYDYAKLRVAEARGPICPLKIIDMNISYVQNHIRCLLANSDMAYLPFSPIREWEDYLGMLMRSREIVQNELRNHPLINRSSVPSNNPRWQNYWIWVRKSYNFVKETIDELQKEYQEVSLRLNDAKHIADLEVMKQHAVVGLTTTCAAKIQSSLRALKAPIVLVEEAAEILESHVVCAMTKDCQQVILIGDHKQLRPKASDYDLGTKYNLNISLFERMVQVRGECPQLRHQHRMRPDIAKLITPSIYEILLNDKSVYTYPHVKGLTKNLFFLNHTSREKNDQSMDDSFVNSHEVEFLTALAKHLLMQGYSPDEITILCTYTGQMFAFMNETNKHSLLRQVRVTTVDNYQGEENKIILLSLVRNNGEGNVGFLKEENRVCVSLSRAREGMYIMGNMSDLVEKNKIWPKIKEVLENQNAIGHYLSLRCQIHADQYFKVMKDEDFKQCPEGGCSQLCDLLLPCGHSCTNICHVLDREHKDYKCKQKCTKSCPNSHPCSLLCWQGCQPCLVQVERTLKCGHTVKMPCSVAPDLFKCPVEVDATLPNCNHEVIKFCHQSIDEVPCTHKCEIRLECGHACLKKCHVISDPDHLQYECNKQCTRKNVNCVGDHICKKRCHEKCEPCPILVNKTRSCGHYYNNVACSLNVEDVLCLRKCDRKMSCGHKCYLKCSEKCKNCPVKVKKESSCGHTIEVQCCEEATPSKCPKNCPKTLPCGHLCTKKCKDICTEICCVMMPLSEPGFCGHIFSIPCFLKKSDPQARILVKYCKQPCDYELACTHKCKGDCGSCFQGRMHIACKEPCRNVFICGHECKILCNDECQPCTQKCELKCSHSKCGKKCGEPCALCKEECKRKCKHQACKKRCYEMCDVDACSEPCEKKLKCSHSCVGFCGDPCPLLCKICDNDELTEILFGCEDDPNARFVLLPDCKHSIESKGLMQWIKPAKTEDSPIEIKTPVCPKCKTPIKSCSRLLNEIREDLQNVMAVKNKLFFNNKKHLMRDRQNEHLKVLENMRKHVALIVFDNMKRYIEYLQTFGKPDRYQKKNRYQPTLSFNELNALDNILDIVKEILSVLDKMKKIKIPFDFITDQVKILYSALPQKLSISKQRLIDLQLEMRRLHLMVAVYNLSSDTLTSTYKQEYDLIVDKLLDIKRFTTAKESEIISNLANLKEQYFIKIERPNIIKAIGLQKGHWFKCPNGHYYAIGECGGANQRGKCNECHANIGGANHQLEANNSLATELDGASEPAWTTALLR